MSVLISIPPPSATHVPVALTALEHHSQLNLFQTEGKDKEKCIGRDGWTEFDSIYDNVFKLGFNTREGRKKGIPEIKCKT